MKGQGSGSIAREYHRFRPMRHPQRGDRRRRVSRRNKSRLDRVKVRGFLLRRLDLPTGLAGAPSGWRPRHGGSEDEG